MLREHQTKQIIGPLVILLILLTLYWGTIFSFVSFQDFLKTASFSPNFISLAFGFIGLIAWVNAIYYFKRIRKYGIVRLWRSFIIENRKRIIFATIATIVFFAIGEYAQRNNLPGIALNILYIFSLPLQLADFIRITTDVFISRFAVFLEFMRIFNPVLHVGAEFILFYYVSKIFYRTKKVKLKDTHGK